MCPAHFSHTSPSRQKDLKPPCHRHSLPPQPHPCCSSPRPTLWSVMRAEHASDPGLLLSFLFPSKSPTQVLLRPLGAGRGSGSLRACAEVRVLLGRGATYICQVSRGVRVLRFRIPWMPVACPFCWCPCRQHSAEGWDSGAGLPDSASRLGASFLTCLSQFPYLGKRLTEHLQSPEEVCALPSKVGEFPLEKLEIKQSTNIVSPGPVLRSRHRITGCWRWL